MDAKTVLLVDDDVDLLDINRITLEAGGFDVVTAENGDDAMRIATTRRVDVAVLDVMMTTPTEGFLLARAMRRDDRTKHIPLLMLTSVNAENEAQGSPFRFTDGDKDPLCDEGCGVIVWGVVRMEGSTWRDRVNGVLSAWRI